MIEGRIQKALSGFYYVDTGREVLTCRARGKFRKEGRLRFLHSTWCWGFMHLLVNCPLIHFAFL